MSLKRHSKSKCAYCGGAHESHQCPMLMMPPAMPMPMGGNMGGMMPDMGMGGMMPDMGMGGMMPGCPMPLPTPKPMPMPEMEQMMNMMMEHGMLLHEIHQGVMQLLQICQAMQTGYAKG